MKIRHLMVSQIHRLFFGVLLNGEVLLFSRKMCVSHINNIVFNLQKNTLIYIDGLLIFFLLSVYIHG